jgi:hypothetical protein
MMVEISEYKQVKIIYENVLMIDQKNKEMEQINSKIF